MEKTAPDTMSTDVNENTAFPAKREISDLPVEVISHIFNFLTVLDIQEARLVCLKWYMASQAPAVLEREKVVPSKEYNCWNPDLLLKSNREFFNLSLMDINDAAWYSEDFWSQFGPTLRSLSLRYCNIKEGQLLRILCFCPRLKYLEINECEFLFSSDSQVARKKKNENIAPKLFHLQNLKIANISDPSCELFDKLVESAPNLVSLSLDDCLTTNSFQRGGVRPLTYKHIVEYLREKPHHINTLHITCCEEEDDEAFVTAATLPNLQLKSLQTDYSKIGSLLKCQIWLQEIDLNCDAKDTLLQTICVNIPNLKHLTLHYCSDVTYLGIIALSMLTKLTSLKLLQCRQVCGEAVLKALCNDYNRTLIKLTMTELGLVSHLHIVALAKAHPSLIHLDLSYCVGVTDWSVQAIFRYQKSLQSLILVQCRNLTDAGLSGKKMYHKIYYKDIKGGRSEVCKYLMHLECCDNEGYLNPTGCGISELKYLQKLDIGSCNIKGVSFENGLKLPAIRHLILDSNMIPVTAFKFLFDNNRTIETLELSDCDGVQDDLIPVVVGKLKRLKSIDIEDCKGVSKQSIITLLQHCKRVKL